jgi:hypothetical protein
MKVACISSVMAMMLCPFVAQSFVVVPPPQILSRATPLQLQGSESSASNDDETAIIVQEPTAEYGVSYIGGDPCGSKYNNDPFDAQVQKPGMPDDMKARIQALVDKKVAEENKEQAEKQADQ